MAVPTLLVKGRDARWNGRKLHVYIPPEMLVEIHAEAARLGLKTSALMRRVWRIARPGLANLPTTGEGVPLGAARRDGDDEGPRSS